MAVPKCKECDKLHQYKIGKRTFYDCYHSDNYVVGRRIYSKVIKTSPQWCPKRPVKSKELTEEEKKHLDALIRQVSNNLFLKYK